MVSSCGSKAREMGSTTAFASGIQATEADHQMAQSGHVLRSVSGAYRRLIFAEGDITDVVDKIFNRPMAPTGDLEPSGVQLGGRAAGQEDFGFFRDANRFEMMGGADNDSGLDGVGETAAFGGDLEGMNLASLMPAVALVQSEVRREKKRRSALGRVGRVSGIAWVDCL